MEIEKKTILWKYRKLLRKDGEMEVGEHEIRIRLTQFRNPKYISIGYSSSLSNWDEENSYPLPTHPKYRPLIKRIDKLLEDIDFEIKLAQKNNETHITSDEIKRRVLNKSGKPINTNLLELFDKIINDLETEGRVGYADVFKNCKATVKKVLHKDKSLTAFTKNDAEEYESFLINNSNKPTTVSNYLRTFYRVWNIAIAKGLCPKEYHPSKHIKFKPYRKLKTNKRAISFEEMKAIENLKFDYDSRLFRSQQYFLFSYYTRGINFVDMAKLKYNTHINENILTYTRSKNKRDYEFTMHSKSLSILETFKHYPLQSDAGYIFPILKASHKTPRSIDTRIDSALKDLNEDLKIMGKMVKMKKEPTSYAARHSFASHLKHKRVDVSLIQEALGHETEEQTRTYLEEFDDHILAQSIEEALQ